MGFVFALGCGPALTDMPDVADEDGSTSDDAPGSEDDGPTTPSDPGEAGSTSGDPAGSTTDDEPDAETGETDATGDTGEDNDDPGECGCEENIPVGFEDVTQGHSASSIVAALQTTDIAWEWLVFEGSPSETVLHVSIAYSGGQVLNGPGGDNGCAFLSAPCPGELIIPVDVTVTSDDGILGASAGGTLEVDIEEFQAAELRLNPTQMDLGGTFGEQIIPEQEGPVEAIGIEFRWSLEGELEGGYLAGNIPSGWDLIGRTL